MSRNSKYGNQGLTNSSKDSKMVANNSSKLPVKTSNNMDKDSSENDSKLNQSIVSVESNHKQYSIYSPIKGLKNKKSSNILIFESKINEFRTC